VRRVLAKKIHIMDTKDTGREEGGRSRQGRPVLAGNKRTCEELPAGMVKRQRRGGKEGTGEIII